MKSRRIAAILAVLLGSSALAEFRTWTGTTGSQLKAELIKDSEGRVFLRDETGRERMVPRSYLSPADIEYLDNLVAPTLKMEPDIKVVSVFKSGAGVVQVVRYSIEVRKISSASYTAPIRIALHLVGTVGVEKTFVVLQRTDEPIRFTSAKRNVRISGPDLSLGSPELQKKYDVEYVGYLIIASTTDGRIIQVESDNKELKANAGFISKFKAGDLFGSDMKLID
jgi:hypothetical protein